MGTRKNLILQYTSLIGTLKKENLANDLHYNLYTNHYNADIGKISASRTLKAVRINIQESLDDLYGLECLLNN